MVQRHSSIDRKQSRVRVEILTVASLILFASSPALGFLIHTDTRMRCRDRTLIYQARQHADEMRNEPAMRRIRAKSMPRRGSTGTRSTSAVPAPGRSMETTTTKRRKTRGRNLQGKSSWIESLNNHHLLTKDEELEYGRAVQRARNLQAALDLAMQMKQDQTLQHPRILGQDELKERIHVERKQNEFSFQGYGVVDGQRWRTSNDRLVETRLVSSRLRKQFEALTDREIATLLKVPGGRKELNEILNDGSEARRALMQNNIRLVHAIARRCTKRSMGTNERPNPNFDDIMHEGIMGLAQAVDRYNPEMNYRFSTYATWWITHSVQTCIRNSYTGLRLPSNFFDVKNKYKRAVQRYLNEEAKVPHISVIAEEIGVKVPRLRRVMSLTQSMISFDRPVRSQFSKDKANGPREYLDEYIDDSVTLLEDRIDLSILRQNLENAMASELAPHERDLIRLRLGLDDGVKRSFRQVADEFAPMLSVADARRITERALMKLRSPHTLATYKLLSFSESVGVDKSMINLW